MGSHNDLSIRLLTRRLTDYVMARASSPGIPRMTLLGFCLMLGAGCISYPLGLSQEQWNALSVEQQAEYQARQYEIDEQRRMEQERIQRERHEEAMAAARAERERIAAIYKDARYGDIVRVTIQGGALQIYNKPYQYHPVAFELVKGETKPIKVTRADQVAQSVVFSARLSDDGNMLFFDDSGPCQVVLANRNWDRGETYPPSEGCGNTGLAGAIFTLKYKDLPGGPQRIFIEEKRLNGPIEARH